jgi:hypothetical protein
MIAMRLPNGYITNIPETHERWVNMSIGNYGKYLEFRRARKNCIDWKNRRMRIEPNALQKQVKLWQHDYEYEFDMLLDIVVDDDDDEEEEGS